MTTGLLVFVYRKGCGTDCAMGGLTSRVQQAVLLGAEGPFEVTADLEPLYLANWKGRLIAVPEDIVLVDRRVKGDFTVDSLHGWMFGGNFVYSSDGRFPSGAPIHVYDRKECRG